MDHSTLTDHVANCDAPKGKKRFLLRAFAALIVLVCFVQMNAKAQGPHPSCNISGPLEAQASGPDLIINVEVAHSTANPQLTYAFSSNTSGAVIRSQGPVVFNAATNSVKQQLTVSPGTTGAAEFNLKLTVVTANGSSECSKSVSVSQ